MQQRTGKQELASPDDYQVQESDPAAITYSAVSARSGVGRATLYRHWSGIDSLLQDLLLSRAAAQRPELTGNLDMDLRLALRSMHKRIGGSGRRVEFLTMLERANRDPAARTLLETMERVVPVRSALELAVADGQLPGDFDVSLGVSLLLGPLVHRDFMTASHADGGFIDSVVDSFLGSIETP